MKLLEFLNWKDYPEGGAIYGSNMSYAFAQAVGMGLKEVEFSQDEMTGFLRAYGQNLPADTQITKGDFYFWGVRITKE